MSFWDFFDFLHVGKYKKKIGELTQRNKALEQELEQSRREGQQLQQERQQLQQELLQLQQERQHLQQELQQLQLRQQLRPQAPAQTPVQAPAEENPLDISGFSLPHTDRILIKSSSDIPKAIQKIKNIDGICSFLKKSGDKEAVTLTRAMEEYIKRIQRFEAALPQKQKKWDDDIVSEEATSALFAIMQKSLLTMLPVAILRGSARNPSFYKGLLVELNQYLQQCGVYTLMPSSKEYFDTEDCNFMNILPLPTKNHADDKRVESIERLPYCLDYLDEDEERQVCRVDGQISVYRFEA